MSGDQDLLERATRALREATPPTQDELAAARARLLAAHRGAVKSSRARTLRWVLPLAAVLAAGSALAATPEALERVARAVSTWLAPDTQLAAPRRARSTREVARQLPVAPRPTPVPEPALAPGLPEPTAPLAVEPPASDRTADASVRSARGSHHERRARREASAARPAALQPAAEQTAAAAAPASVPEPEPAPAADADLAAYREAHHQHFRTRDFAAALRDWNLYLLEYPRGTFAVEARYNRAICLVRLGQKDEAKRALTPFARGVVAHGYRQAEANKLLEALE